MKFGLREIIALVLLMTIPIGAWWFVFRPRDAHNTAMLMEIETKQEKLRELNQAIGAIGDLQRQIDALTGAIDDLKSHLPEEKEIDKILQEIWRLADSNNLKAKSIETIKTSHDMNFATGGQSEQPISVHLEGDFDGFYAFLLALENQPRIMRISKMDMEALDRDTPGQVTARFEMSIFFEKNS